MISKLKIFYLCFIYTFVSCIGFYIDYQLSLVLKISIITLSAAELYFARAFISIVSTHVLVIIILYLETELKELTKDYTKSSNIDLSFTLTGQVAPMFYGTILRISGEIIPATMLLVLYSTKIQDFIKLDSITFFGILVAGIFFLFFSKAISDRASLATKVYLSKFKSYLLNWKDVKFLNNHQVTRVLENRHIFIKRYFFWNFISISNSNNTRAYIEIVAIFLLYLGTIELGSAGSVYILYRVGITYVNGISYLTNLLHYYGLYKILENIHASEKFLKTADSKLKCNT